MKKFLLFIVTLVFCFSSLGYGYCPKTGERVSGMNKICYYDCLSGTVAITIKSYKICPLTINN